MAAYLETAKGSYPALAERFETFEDLHRRKLWHQLTLKIEESLEENEFQRGDLLIPFYKQFIATFAHKINLLKLARFAKDVGSHFGEPDEAGKEQIKLLVQSCDCIPWHCRCEGCGSDIPERGTR